MKVIETVIKGLLIIEPDVFGDDRGYFMESYAKQKYKDVGLDIDFVQDNESLSAKGIVRGLHMQKGEHAQGKLVRVISGSVIDVAVDCRPESETYGQHVKVELSGKNKKQFWVPRGFAHGFETLEDNTLFCYKCDNSYNKDSELGVMWNDSDLGIEWQAQNPVLSEKDQNNIAFADLKNYL